MYGPNDAESQTACPTHGRGSARTVNTEDVPPTNKAIKTAKEALRTLVKRTRLRMRRAITIS